MPKKKSTDFTETTRVGSVYQVFESYRKSGLDASGRAPVFVEPEVIKKKIKGLNSI